MKKITLIVSIFFATSVIYSQDVHFSFSNSQLTNDGANDYFEADVMVQTINSSGSFKLGSGLLYFNYNVLAFGENAVGTNLFDVTCPEGQGYLCAQGVDAAEPATDIYGPFNITDNTTSRAAWAFSQAFSSSTFATDNVTDVPTKLCHIRIQFVDVNENPMLEFEDGTTPTDYTNQFYTACGSTNVGPFEIADCTNFIGTQITNDSFNSFGGSLSIKEDNLFKNLLIFPNPGRDLLNVNIDFNSNYKIIDINGRGVLSGQLLRGSNHLVTKTLQGGVYFMKFNSERGTTTKKIIIE